MITMMMAGRQIEAGHSKQAQAWADFLAMMTKQVKEDQEHKSTQIAAETMLWDG
ncbi:hypothetical protein [Lacticaseibacillus manihotivorans]|uniref:hypothetical protein n=1 Tax=Lacticaseibacillus manihotivorans TaxID=88233 RepID=UPI001FB287BC|nr:hypothetical protein [Lacticaseibacillus manihotivorans]